jgi:hypothetical protein
MRVSFLYITVDSATLPAYIAANCSVSYPDRERQREQSTTNKAVLAHDQ